MQLFYTNHIQGDTAYFTQEEFRHAVKSLRLKTGSTIYFTDGKGHAFEGLISMISHDAMEARIIRTEKKDTGRPYTLHIGISPLKNPDRLEWFIEKAVEIGIDSITPLLCKRSEKPSVKTARLEHLVHSAAKQSLKYHFPVIGPLTSFADFMEHSGMHKYIFHCAEGVKRPITTLQAQGTIVALIGPEGDFTPEEIQRAAQNGFEAITIGHERLRTETAAVYVCNSFHLIANFAP